MGARREFRIDQDFAGGRLETFLRVRLGLPRTLALKAIRKGWIRLDGHRTRVDARVASGATVVVTNPALALPAVEGAAGATREPRAPPVPADVRTRAAHSIRLQTSDFVVSNKPAGFVVHAGSGHESGWIDALAAACGGALAVIGRLDRDTSGLVLLGRRRAATRALFEALRAGGVDREYLALANGRIASDGGVIDLPLAKTRADDGFERVGRADGSEASARPARTRFRVVERGASATLVTCRIETGRTHQIRAHLAEIGHPILGDARYRGRVGDAGALARAIGLSRLFLHAGVLEFPDPSTGKPHRIEEPLPDDLSQPLARLRSRAGSRTSS